MLGMEPRAHMGCASALPPSFTPSPWQFVMLIPIHLVGVCELPGALLGFEALPVLWEPIFWWGSVGLELVIHDLVSQGIPQWSEEMQWQTK
jgi:hypothetical protein